MAEEHLCLAQTDYRYDKARKPESQCLKMGLHIRKQEREIAAVMMMRHDPSGDTPEPFNTIGIRVIGRRINEVQLLLQLTQHAKHEQGPG